SCLCGVHGLRPPPPRPPRRSSDLATARREAARTALSGPAGGAVGAFHVARLAGYERIITFDMGGTSTDVALFPGDIVYTREATIDRKSTRLNSSHVKISYAGFCLK